MHDADLLALFIDDMHLLLQLAHLDLRAKDGRVIAPENKSFKELELAYGRQLVEQY